MAREMAVVLPLTHCTKHCANVCWSRDDRIAVAANEFVYVYTLKGAYFTKEKPLKYGSPVDLSMACAPDGIPSPVPMLKGVAYTPELRDLGIFVDPIFSISSSLPGELFTQVEWSPMGCCELGRCLLTCCTKSGNLLIYSPPSLCITQWKRVLNLTEKLSEMLASVDYDVTKCAAKISDHGSVDNEDNLPLSGPAAKTMKLFQQYKSKRLLLVITASSWFPQLCGEPGNANSKTAVLATAARAGYLLLWTAEAPLSDSTEMKLIESISLPVAANHWVCTMKWNMTRTGVVTLAVGCTSGQVFCLNWSAPLIEWSDQGSHLSTHHLTSLWSQDDMTVDQLAWSNPKEESLNFSWLIMAKNSNILLIPVRCDQPGSSHQEWPHNCLVCGVHSGPVSGISVLHDENVITSALDGSLQRFTLPPSPCWSHNKHVIRPHQLFLDSPPKNCTYSIQGLATSSNHIFTAVTVNPNYDFAYNIKKFRSQLHLLSIKPAEQISTLLSDKALVPTWDVYEYMRGHSCVTSETLSTNLTMTTRLQLKRMIENYSDRNEEETCSKSSLAFLHAKNMLTEYMEWRTSAQALTDKMCCVSLSNMATYIKSHENATTEDDQLSDNVLKSLKHQDISEELCPLCNSIVPFQHFNEECCPQGHKQERGSISLMLLTDPLFTSRCSICNAPAIVPNYCSKSSWLWHVYRHHPTCPYCGGYFERVV